MFAFGSFLFADVAAPAKSIYNDFQYFGMACLSTLVFGGIGIILAIIGFKLFDLLTPGKLEEEIIRKQNLATATFRAASVLGICHIVAHAVGG